MLQIIGDQSGRSQLAQQGFGPWRWVRVRVGVAGGDARCSVVVMLLVGQMRVPCCQRLQQRAARIQGLYHLPAGKALHSRRHCGRWESGISCRRPLAGHSSCNGSARSLRESDRLRVGRWLCALGKMVQQNVNQQVRAACVRGV